jgi:hypothetical protein
LVAGRALILGKELDVDLVIWTCPVHGIVAQHSDDGCPDSKSAVPPDYPLCKGPSDEEQGQWLYQCERDLTRAVIAD